MKHNKKNDEKNWYVRMHQYSLSSVRPKSQKFSLNLSIFFRIWFAFAFIVIIAGLMVFHQLFEYIEPTSKQVIEDTLVDTSKLLAVTLATPLESGELTSVGYQAQLDRAFNQSSSRNHAQRIDRDSLHELNHWFLAKEYSSFRVYITDHKGIVLYDSLSLNHHKSLGDLAIDQNAEGKDYSQWNDVYLTLQNKYGARISHDLENDHPNRIMYVAEAIKNAQGKILGVVSVGKPIASIEPYINVARERMWTTSVGIMLLAVLFAGVIAWWLRQSIALVKRYTIGLASETTKPSFYFGHELNELTDAIEQMKHHLENKGYVTDYVHTLTHELKSPLTAIKASGELLAESDLDQEDRQILSETITEQSYKLQLLIDRLLLLSKIEQPNFQLNTKPIAIISLLKILIDNQQATIKQRQLTLTFYYNNQPSNMTEMVQYSQQLLVMADEFWLSQALNNIIENAIYFAENHIVIRVTDKRLTSNKSSLRLQIINDCQPIPDYALGKVFDRYFSLSHQVNKQKKGTGLGLTLAKQVIEHHGGHIDIENVSLHDYIHEDVKDGVNHGLNRSAVVLTIVI